MHSTLAQFLRGFVRYLLNGLLACAMLLLFAFGPVAEAADLKVKYNPKQAELTVKDTVHRHTHHFRLEPMPGWTVEPTGISATVEVRVGTDKLVHTGSDYTNRATDRFLLQAYTAEGKLHWMLGLPANSLEDSQPDNTDIVWEHYPGQTPQQLLDRMAGPIHHAQALGSYERGGQYVSSTGATVVMEVVAGGWNNAHLRSIVLHPDGRVSLGSGWGNRGITVEGVAGAQGGLVYQLQVCEQYTCTPYMVDRGELIEIIPPEPECPEPEPVEEEEEEPKAKRRR